MITRTSTNKKQYVKRRSLSEAINEFILLENFYSKETNIKVCIYIMMK